MNGILVTYMGRIWFSKTVSFTNKLCFKKRCVTLQTFIDKSWQISVMGINSFPNSSSQFFFGLQLQFSGRWAKITGKQQLHQLICYLDILWWKVEMGVASKIIHHAHEKLLVLCFGERLICGWRIKIKKNQVNLLYFHKDFFLAIAFF